MASQCHTRRLLPDSKLSVGPFCIEHAEMNVIATHKCTRCDMPCCDRDSHACEVQRLFPECRAFTMQEFTSYILVRAPLQTGWALFGVEHMPLAYRYAIEFIQSQYNPT